MTKGIIIEDLSVLIDTHDLHRRAFNQAFIECGLPWEWDNQTFDEMVHIHKSVDKIIHYNDTHGGLEIHSAEFINSVSELFFERLLARNPLKMLPGIQELLAMAKRNNYHVLLSTLEPKSLVLSALASASIPIDCFASITQKERPEFDEHYYSDFTHSQTTFNAEIDELLIIQKGSRLDAAHLIPQPIVKSLTYNTNIHPPKLNTSTMIKSLGDMLTRVSNISSMR